MIITVRLDEDLSEKLDAIKHTRGLVNATDLIRLLIVEAYKREAKPE